MGWLRQHLIECMIVALFALLTWVAKQDANQNIQLAVIAANQSTQSEIFELKRKELKETLLADQRRYEKSITSKYEEFEKTLGTISKAVNHANEGERTLREMVVNIDSYMDVLKDREKREYYRRPVIAPTIERPASEG